MPADHLNLDLPSLDSLRVFEIVARHLNLNKAAMELGVTQSAVSHRMSALERSLRTRLFRRGRGALELTDAGQSLFSGVRRGIEEIRSTIASLGGGNRRAHLTISVLYSFALRWLTPRLPKFRERFPAIDIALQAEDLLADLISPSVDAGIRFGHGSYPGMHVTRILPDSTTPVCSPSFAAKIGAITQPSEIQRFTLLHDSNAEKNGGGADWNAWFRHVGAEDVSCEAGLRFNSASLVIEAAAAGLGIALARVSLLGSDLRTGRLVCLLPVEAPTSFSYYFLSLREKANDPRIRVFRRWLIEEAGKAATDR